MSTPAERLDSQLMEDIAQRIRAAVDAKHYDYRDAVPLSILERFPHIAEDYHALYGKYKWAIASVLKPKTIYEVGIGWGLAARAFVSAAPDAHYFGIDTEEMGVACSEALAGLEARQYRNGCDFRVVDSDDLNLFVHPYGPIGLIHIDGCHELEHKARDVEKAVRSGVQWMLCDDVADPMVAAGVFKGLHTCWKRQIPMAYFENSHTGSLLIHVAGGQ